jgi:hypothetical protein
MRTPKHSGQHGGAISARALIAAGTAGSSLTPMAYRAQTRPRWNAAALAMATATTMAFAPIVISHPAPLHLPSVPAPSINLTADPGRIQDVIASVNVQLASLDSDIANIVGVPGQTLAGALTGAASLNSNFWQTLITAANGDKLIGSALRSLEQLTSGGLTQLATSVSSANSNVTLTTDELSTLLTSTLTGSASTALAAFSGLAANPLNFSAWLSLIDAPFTIAGGVLNNAITAAQNLGANTIAIGGTIVHGVTAQISNIVDAVNNLVSGAQGQVQNNIVAGLITAVQGVVSAPLNAVLSLVDGGTNVVTGVATDVVSVIANAAKHVSSVWLGDGTTSGAIQTAIDDIGTAPLDVGSYARAVVTLARAAVSTVTGTAGVIVSGLAPIPFTAAAAVVNTIAGTITSFTDGVAKIGAGLLVASGVPSLISNTVYGLAGAFNAGVRLVAGVVAAGLNATAGLLNIGTTLTGFAAPATASLAASSKTVSLAAADTAEGVDKKSGSVAASTSAPDSTESSTSGPKHPATTTDDKPDETKPTDDAPATPGTTTSPGSASTPGNTEGSTDTAGGSTGTTAQTGSSTTGSTHGSAGDTSTPGSTAGSTGTTSSTGSSTTGPKHAATPGETKTAGTGGSTGTSASTGSSTTGPKHAATPGETKTGSTESPSASESSASTSAGKSSQDGRKDAQSTKSGGTAHDSTPKSDTGARHAA